MSSVHLISNALQRPPSDESLPQSASKGVERRRGGLPDERALELCEGMIDIAAALFSVSGKDLRRAGRTSLDVSRVRQIAMYVAHVILRLNMTDVGRGFGRDRTTVLHACHLIEDLRDDEDFDRIVAMTERVALAAFGNRLGL
jgi:hypothetical protein